MKVLNDFNFMKNIDSLLKSDSFGDQFPEKNKFSFQSVLQMKQSSNKVDNLKHLDEKNIHNFRSLLSSNQSIDYESDNFLQLIFLDGTDDNSSASLITRLPGEVNNSNQQLINENEDNAITNIVGREQAESKDSESTLLEVNQEDSVVHDLEEAMNAILENTQEEERKDLQIEIKQEGSAVQNLEEAMNILLDNTPVKEQEDLLQNYELLLQTINEISTFIKDGKNPLQSKENATRLLQVLHQWTSLKNQLSDSDLNRIMTNNMTEKEITIWKQMINVYEKRSHFTKQKMYQEN